MLNELIEYDPTGKAGEAQLATKEINKTIEKIKSQKIEVQQEIKDLRTAQGKTNKFKEKIDAKYELFSELNSNQKKLENKVELKEVEDTGWKKQIDANYTIGKHETKADFQSSSENSKVQKDIMESSGLKNMIRQGQTKLDITDKIEGEFLENVQFEIIKRFNKNYDPGKINEKYGRALTPFEYLTTGQQSKSSIIYRAIGDVAIRMGKQPKTVAADAYEGGYGAFESMVSESGYSKLDSHTGSPVEAKGIVVAEALGINPVTVKRAAGDAKNLNFETNAGAKEKASYKNIGKNYKETIEKDIVVDYYGVSEAMYSKMKNSAGEQLNKPDFEAIESKIKPNIETHIKLIPKWGQISVDPITGESISMKTVSGVKSETKATGITTVLLKNKLLFNEIQQTGTKGSKYEWTAELKEYHKSIDPVFKKQFEQKVLDSWGMGETVFNRAQRSGTYKAIMTQTGKAVYLQSVKQAIPSTPSLTAKHALANMLNQVSAGQSTSLAKTQINDIMKLLEKNVLELSDIRELAKKIPSKKEELIVLEQLFMERQGYSKDIDVVKMNERLESEASGTSKEIDFQNSVNRSRQIAKEMKLNQNASDPMYISKNPGEKIIVTKNGKKVETTLDAWRKDLDVQVLNKFLENSGHTIESLDGLTPKKGKQMHRAIESLVIELGLASSQSRKQMTIDGSMVYINKGKKKNSQHLKDFYETSFENKNAIKENTKYGKVHSPDWSTEKKNLAKLETKKSLEEIAADKIEAYRKSGSYSGKSKDFEVTEKANREFFEDFLTAQAEVAYKNKNSFGIEYILQHRAMQTNHTKGASKSFGYSVMTVNAKGSKLGTMETTGAKGDVKTKEVNVSNHWEHGLQLLNQTNRILDLMKKHKGTTPAWKQGLKEILDISNQHLIPKRGQLFNDAKGPTTFTKAYIETLKKGIDNPLLNVFANKYTRLENQFIISGPNKGKNLLEVQVESIDLNIAKKIVSIIPKSKWGVLEHLLNAKATNGKAVEKQNTNLIEKAIGKKMAKQVASKKINKTIKNIDAALENGRKINKVARGMSTFDFDKTAGDSDNFIFASKGKKKKKISADEWPFVGESLGKEGWKFDFTDFNKVTNGRPGPLMQKMKNQIKKYGPENVFILTARAPESAKAIFDFLKTQGAEIPFKNITGLGNSTGEAKALWMLEKFAEGYNDMYFVDDAISNVKAVKDVLDQLDIKSSVQITLAKTNLNEATNKILEHSLSIGSEKVFSKAEAKVRGKDIKRRRVFMRDSAADLELLIEPLYGKGKKGNENKKWFKENFIMPFERGTRDYNTARQSSKNDYMALRKQNKDVVKMISKEVEGTSFTNDMAMRVYLWNRAGYKIPDLAKTTETKLVEHVLSDPKLQAYAEQFAKITKQEKGLKEPGENWWGETMAGEVTNIDRGVSRKQYLQEFIDVKNEIFTESNLNKMESKLGTRWRENIEDMFDRMETGRTRSLKLDRGSTAMMNYLNGGIGTIMNFNTRSAALQTISTLNFLNMRENNPLSAARAMANVPQFAKDFLYIMNSDMLRQRRDGLAINVTEAEIASAAASSPNMIQGVISKVLKVGYTPTKLADSFAISFGGATFYRNRIRMYKKQGMEIKAAEKQAFLDFQVLAERTQQSSRADLLSRQQTSLIGRIVLPFANTPMQMNRAGMKDILDIAKGRTKGFRNTSEAVGRITYYMGAQVAMFTGLQSALFAMLYNNDDVTEEKIANTKAYVLQSTIDSMLRGFGVQGALISSFKNATLEFFKQNAKPAFKSDYSEVAEDLLNLSPPIGSKFGLLDSAGDDLKYAKDTPFKFELGNPKLEAGLKTIQATTNAPVYSPYQNIDNLKHAVSDQYETWQRILMGAGWTPYNVGIESIKKQKKSSEKYNKSIDKNVNL